MVTVGASGAAGLAGCTGSGNEAGMQDGSGGGSSGGRVDRAFRFVGDMVPEKMQFNPYNPNNYSARAEAILYDPLAKYNPDGADFIPYLVTDWEIAADSMSLSLREGQTWHDGTAVTADDLAAQLSFEVDLGYAISNYVSAVDAVDETTVVLTLPQAVNETVLQHTVLRKRLNTPAHLFESELAAFADADSEEATDDATSQLVSKKLTEAVGNSPFALERTSSQQFTAVIRDDHPDSAKINFTRFEGLHLPGQSTWQALKQGQLDGTPNAFIAEEVVDTFPDTIVEKRLPGSVGYGLFFDHSDDVFGRPAVRQALAHVIAREDVAQNSGGNLKIPVDTITGIPTAETERYLGDVVDSYDSYETNHEKAAVLLEGEGFTKEGGTWRTPDGSTFEAPVTTPAEFPDWMKASQTVVGQLNEFGIDAEVDATEVTTFFGEVYPSGDFKLVTHFWGGFNPYPYFGLQSVLGGGYPHNFPETVEVPPVGEPDGAVSEVDLAAKVTELGTSSGVDADELIRELTWAFNQTLPAIPVQEKFQQTFLTNDEWDVPSKNDPVMEVRWPVYWLPRVGELAAK